MAAFGDPRSNQFVRRTYDAKKVKQAEQLLLSELAGLHEPAVKAKLKTNQDHNKKVKDQIDGESDRLRRERRLAQIEAEKLALQSGADAGIVPG